MDAPIYAQMGFIGPFLDYDPLSGKGEADCARQILYPVLLPVHPLNHICQLWLNGSSSGIYVPDSGGWLVECNQGSKGYYNIHVRVRINVNYLSIYRRNKQTAITHD
ncbi:hypothetical protein D3C85_1673620 [compost metagenome]